MAYPTVTNTFTSGDDLDATELNTNYSDIINGITDGKKDIKVATVTANNIVASTDVVITTDLTCTEFTSRTLTIPLITVTELFTKIMKMTASSKTMAANAVIPTASLTEVNGETGAADDLETITATNFSEGGILLLYKKSTSGDITIKNGTGNIKCGSDRVLGTDSTALLIYDGTNWDLLFYQGN